MREESGCWVGDIVSGRWGWQTTDASQHGHINMSSPACNSNLITRAELLYESGWDSARWQTEVEQYLLDNRELCPRARLSPVTQASPGCPEKTPTGQFDNGVVVHWDSRRLFDGLPVCWVGNLNPTADGLVWNAYDETGTRVPLLVQATLPAQEEPAPSAEAAGICGRTPAVQDAILAALNQTACSAVTDANLATITALSLKTDRVSAADVAGLTAITDIDLELTDGLDAHLASLTTLRNAHITFHLVTTNQPILREASERYNIPDDFLPHKDPDGDPQSDTGFDNLRFTISEGRYPGYPYSESPGGASLPEHLVASNWAATNVHITERTWSANPPSLTIPQMGFSNITNLTIEVEYIAHEDARPISAIGAPSDIYDRTRNSLTSLKIVNLTPDIPLSIPENYISLHPGKDTGIPTLTVEIRGRIRNVHKEAFHSAFLKELHLDPETDGDEHRLTFDSLFVRPPAEGTGWCVESSTHPKSCTN